MAGAAEASERADLGRERTGVSRCRSTMGGGAAAWLGAGPGAGAGAATVDGVPVLQASFRPAPPIQPAETKAQAVAC